MASWSKALLSPTLHPFPSFSSSSRPLLPFLCNSPVPFIGYPVPLSFAHSTGIKPKGFSTYPLTSKTICKAAEYKFPDPIPEFADAETEKFRTHMLRKLTKKDIYGNSVEEIVGICTEIFRTFLHTEYGGPGTLLVIPFIDMADTLNERGLPGGPQAARAAIKWAQDHVDNDWDEWTGSN